MAETRKPLLIFDGECGFCRRWIENWRLCTKDAVEYAPYQEAAPRHPDIPAAEFERSVWLIEPDGRKTKAAEAVFRALSYAGGVFSKAPLALYQKIPPFRFLSEMFYALVARHRKQASGIDRGVFGHAPLRRRVSMLFLRLLAVVYFLAFLSLAVQIDGLVGSGGILPVDDFLRAVRANTGAERFWLIPSVFWLNASDAALAAVCWGGVFCAALAAAFMPVRAVFAALWIFYLSLSSASGIFLGYQWDALLLECGLLAVLLAPNRLASRRDPPLGPILLYQWLLFRLMFSSGIVKWQSGDRAWRTLEAMKFHYETQPLPTPLAWFAHQLPAAFQVFSSGAVFFLETAVPLLIFTTPRLRRCAAWLMIGLQTLIFLTGNYCFFNFLAIALCLFLFTDEDFAFARPRGLAACEWSTDAAKPRPSAERRIVAGFSILIFAASLAVFWPRVWRESEAPAPLRAVAAALEPLASVNPYGLFAVMTTARREIVLEGSNDGTNWIEYDFRYKPQALDRVPGWVAPHQPRLDWQMWFAVLSSYKQNPWFLRFCQKILEGSPSVRALLKNDPFGASPPKYLRASLYRYRFTSAAERKATGNVWKREPLGLYCAILSLEEKPRPGVL